MYEIDSDNNINNEKTLRTFKELLLSTQDDEDFETTSSVEQVILFILLF